MGLFKDKNAEKEETVNASEMEESKEPVVDQAADNASEEARKAVLAMKAATMNEDAKADSQESEAADEPNALEKAVEEKLNEEKKQYIVHSNEWKNKLSALQKEIEEELQKSDDAIKEAVEKEKEACRNSLLKDEKSKYEKEIEQIKEENKKAMDKMTAEHQAEIEKMKHTYEMQLEDSQSTLREKITGLRKEIDRYKEQTELLMLHIEDTFVLQEIQKQMDEKEKGNEESKAAEEKTAEADAE